jgi:D-alanine-D-alanine ligase
MEVESLNSIKTVALVYWGKSREQHSDNQQTIDNIKNAIENLGLTCVLYQQSDPQFAKRIVQDMPDFALNYVPGDYGEDGRLSGFFEVVGIPHSHPGWFHHAVSIHKQTAKLFFRENGLDCPAGRVVTRREIITNKKLHNYPYVLKPIDSGSSINTLLVKDEFSYNFSEDNCPFESDALVEEFIPGDEYTVTVFDGKTVGIVQVSSKKAFLDYESKNGEEIDFEAKVDPEIPEELKERILIVAENSYKAVRATSIARVDIRYDVENDRIVVLEINTIPGMTPSSFAPLAFKEYLGIDFTGMIKLIIKDGLNYWRKREELENEYRKKGFFS